MFDCATEDFEPPTEEQCRVGRYVYGKQAASDLSYEITYIDRPSRKIDIINDQILQSGTWATNNVYKHIYRNDSLYIKDFNQFKEGVTYITALYGSSGTVTSSVITSFAANGGTYRYTFDYSKDNQVTVSLEKMNGNVATFDSRGVYYLNELADVTKLEITRNPDLHGGDADNYTTRTITYTYDIVQNPLRALILVHFKKAELPDVTFFSPNNRLTEKYDNVNNTYGVEYGTDPMPTKITRPNGVVETFDYPNCTN